MVQPAPHTRFLTVPDKVVEAMRRELDGVAIADLVTRRDLSLIALLKSRYSAATADPLNR
jgi:hypothetical protein